MQDGYKTVLFIELELPACGINSVNGDVDDNDAFVWAIFSYRMMGGCLLLQLLPVDWDVEQSARAGLESQ